MSESAEKKQLSAEELEFLTTPAGYNKFVDGLAAKPERFKLSSTTVALLVDQLYDLNQASLALDHFKRVITYGDKLRMNPCPRYHGDLQGEGSQRASGDLIHGLLGKITEALELAPVLIKLLTMGSFDTVNIVEELGDDEFYTDMVRQALGCDRQHVLQTNVLKLIDRYDGMTFDPEKALNRDLDSERQVMERAGRGEDANGNDCLGEDQ